MGFFRKFSDVAVLLRTKWMMMTLNTSFANKREDLRFCYDALQDVSRSFAVVIMQLTDADLRDGICLFYLILRALDTVEDDMKLDLQWKIRELEVFHTHLGDPTWTLSNVGHGKEQEVLEQFPRVSREFNRLKPEYQAVISDICQKMAAGMVDFLKRPVITVEDYDLYCHYVAGLVGHGVTRLFANCGFEDAHLADDLTVANGMGLFLQKTNIIRDYFEDIREVPPRMFWPKEIWGNYAKELKEFADRANEKKAVACINHMVANALTHLPAVIDYMLALRDPSVLRFCGIPQVMAIGTLSEVYNNPNTFHVKVKMSKTSACRVMLGTASTQQFLVSFREFSEKLLKKLAPNDPYTPQMKNQLNSIIARIDSLLEKEAIKCKGTSSCFLTSIFKCPFHLLQQTASSVFGLLSHLRIKSKKE